MSKKRKLTDEQYIEIAAAYATAEKCTDIAKRYNIAVCTVRWIAGKLGVPHKGHRNKRQQIIRLSRDNPKMGPFTIAKMVGCSKKYAVRVRTECGFRVRKVRNVAPLVAATTNKSGLQSLSQ